MRDHARGRQIKFGKGGDNEPRVGESFVDPYGRSDTICRKCRQIIILRAISQRHRGCERGYAYGGVESGTVGEC